MIMKFVLILFCVLISFEMGFTQEMSMDPLKQPEKNVFLKMMDTMMVRMDEVRDSSPVESNFTKQMIPHHQGALAMASYEIKYGKDFETIQLAKSIYAEQENEIQLMQIWLGRSADTTHQRALPDGYRLSMKKSMDRMMSDMPSDKQLNNIDQAFSLVMIPHHQAAVDMAKIVLNYSSDRQINFFARQLISSQEVEIEQMTAVIKSIK